MNFIKFTGENIFLVSQLQSIYDQSIQTKKNPEIRGINFEIFEHNHKISIINSEIKMTFDCPISFSKIFSEIKILFELKSLIIDFSFELKCICLGIIIICSIEFKSKFSIICIMFSNSSL